MQKIKKERLLKSIQIFGLTGSIAMGKTTSAGRFSYLGFWVFDADAVIHRVFLSKNTIVKKINQIFPGILTKEGFVDKDALRNIVFNDSKKLEQLETLLHLFVWKELKTFLHFCFRNRQKRILIDIPLLFETGADFLCDRVYVATTSPFLQKMRLRERKMDAMQMKYVLKKQMDDTVKRRYGDVLLYSGLGKGPIVRLIKASLKKR